MRTRTTSAATLPSEVPTRGVPASLLFAATFLAYAVNLRTYECQVTDLSAWRMAHGAVPYRDFWTMYAPGSLTVLGGFFAVFGRELILSRLLGMLTAAAAVAVHYRLARRLVQPRAAWLPSAIFAATFFGTGYYASFSSYAPAILAILLAIDRLAMWAAEPARARHLVSAGLWLGVGAVFKHDVAGYALAAAAVGMLSAPPAEPAISRLRSVFIVGTTAALVVAVPVLILVALGAGRDLLRDLIVFPLTDFRYVRPERFPLVPRLRPGLVPMAKELVVWSLCNLPTVAVAIGLPGIWVRRAGLAGAQRLTLAVMLAAFPCYWLAAHVQLNTHAITLAGLGALVAAAGLAPRDRESRWPWGAGAAATVVTAAWCVVVSLQPAYEMLRRAATGTEPVGVPGLFGISAPPVDAAWMRKLASEMAKADPGAAVLVLGNRNDVLVFADTTPYWLSTRPPATRYHELHPAVTDTEPVQREMVAGLTGQPLPVVVREHRFDPATLERVKGQFLRNVPVGATLLDTWLRDHYTPGPRFGRYELMRPRP
jgi:4-amino-4-deoxy-L-arabinose transferase-like glycosyltransferase